MIIQLDREGRPEGLFQLIQHLQANEKVQGILVLAADGNGFTPADLDAGLQSLDVPIFGGVFPQIVWGEETFATGTLVVGLEKRPEVFPIPRLSDPGEDYEALLEAISIDLLETKTAFIWVDGFASRIAALVEGLFNVFGLECNYLGGGAGSLSLEQKPCLISNQGLLMDHALLAFVDTRCGVGVQHGWRPIGGPFKVTQCNRNLIHSLDWRPAFEVYNEVVTQHTGVAVDTGNFYATAQHFPFGITKLGAEKLVRDPFIVHPDGTIQCVGEILPDSFVHILNGSPEWLIEAAGRASELAQETFPGRADGKPRLLVDCISRSLELQEQFQSELRSVRREGAELIGALTIGEIANNGKDYLEFYNKTAVVGVLDL